MSGNETRAGERVPYYEAYDQRYRIAHAAGVRWMGEAPTPILQDVLTRYGVARDTPMLELGCGEGRDAIPLLRCGYVNLIATDVSPEAIRYCRSLCPDGAERFQVLDCVCGKLEGRFGFLYAVAVLHMLTEDPDRRAFYRFVREHLTPEGLALLCAMGDGTRESATDPRAAFELREREAEGKTLRVTNTSCRVVNWATLERELTESGLLLCEKGLTAAEGQFDCLMYAVVRSDGSEV